MKEKPVLVIGSTGYVGGRLVPLLLESGYRVRAMGRSLEKVAARSWAKHPGFEMVNGDVLDLNSLQNATRGCGAAFYLVHSMVSAGKKFVEADRQGAVNMIEAAFREGLDRIIYLGGLGENLRESLSVHLRSRKEVEDILKSGPVPCTVLRAGAILGSGSAAFEILRYTVDRLPVMLAPRWVRTKNQPIAIRNVLYYLRGCLENDAVLGRTLDIGGPDVLTYQQLAEIYAEEAGLTRRRIIPVPFVSPGFSAFLIHHLTPVPKNLAAPLVEGLRNEAVCRDNRIKQMIPQELLSCRKAVRKALKKIQNEDVETCWSDAGCLMPPEWSYCGDAGYTGGTIMECGYRAELSADSRELWNALVRIGGESGYYFGQFLWDLRGILDRLLGGMGLQRGRRSHSQLRVGDALDFWRVMEVEPEKKLLLLSEMITPGEALLEFRIEQGPHGGTELQILSRFVPKGLLGMAYWFILYPLHQKVFKGMIHGISGSIKRPVIRGPERFTPKIPDSCPPPWDWDQSE